MEIIEDHKAESEEDINEIFLEKKRIFKEGYAQISICHIKQKRKKSLMISPLHDT